MVDTVEIPALNEQQLKKRGRAGKISFDDRGNAVYEWQQSHLTIDGTTGDELRAAALEHPGLSIVEDEPPPGAPVRRNAAGLRVGYNPYDSGQLDQPAGPSTPRKPRDLRALSNWIQLKKKLATVDEK